MSKFSQVLLGKTEKISNFQTRGDKFPKTGRKVNPETPPNPPLFTYGVVCPYVAITRTPMPIELGGIIDWSHCVHHCQESGSGGPTRGRANPDLLSTASADLTSNSRTTQSNSRRAQSATTRGPRGLLRFFPMIEYPPDLRQLVHRQAIGGSTESRVGVNVGSPIDVEGIEVTNGSSTISRRRI